MSDTYVIGDVQGCYDSLQALLDRLELVESDRIWLCGDLVNRGPKSLEVLRWARARPGRVTVVLGNHDLHLLATAEGHRTLKKRDTFGDVLEAGDCENLLNWLREQPLAYRQGDVMMVHAGVHPSWSRDLSLLLAQECATAIRDSRWHSAWSLSRHGAPAWHTNLRGDERLASALSVLVGVRCLGATGELEMGFSGPPGERPHGSEPWFTGGVCEGTIVFGHWAALGLYLGETRIGVDTGCVWGHQLTAIRLRDRKVFHQPSLERLGEHSME